jgi:hypothetical protein
MEAAGSGSTIMARGALKSDVVASGVKAMPSAQPKDLNELDKQLLSLNGGKPTIAQVRKTVFNLIDDLEVRGTRARRAERDYEFAYSKWKDAAKEAKAAGQPAPPEPVDPRKQESSISSELTEVLSEFVYEFQRYQSNDSVRNKQALVDRFEELPKAIQQVLSGKPGDVRRMYRGDEAKRSNTGIGRVAVEAESVASFAGHIRNAGFWGPLLYKGSDMASYKGIIDTRKVADFLGTGYKHASGRPGDIAAKLSGKYGNYEHSVGDDEDERIAYGIRWKKGVGDEEWMEKNNRNLKALRNKRPALWDKD